MQQQWTKWFYSSCVKHFQDNKGIYTLLVEGEERPIKVNTWVEFRLNGPDFEEISKNYYDVTLSINFVLCDVFDHSDLYRIYRAAGYFLSLMTPINIYRYGDGDALLGCIRLTDRVVTKHYGEINETLRVLMSTIDGQYGMKLEE